MKFINSIKYIQDQNKINQLRPQHREYMQGLLAAGKLALAGPLADDSGALLVYEVATLKEAEALAAADPFAIGGVFVAYEIKPWNLVLANTELLQC